MFIFAFGIVTQALLYPNQTLNLTLLGNIFLPAYFILVGDDFTLRGNIMNALTGLTSKKSMKFE